MPAAIYPYTVTNSYKGGLFMRTYSRNVRRAWDGDSYHAPKRQRLDDSTGVPMSFLTAGGKENLTNPIDLEDSLERAIRETSVAAFSSSPSRKNSTIFSLESQEDDNGSNTITPPSSPPPTLQLTPPKTKARKPTFSTLDKERRQREKFKLAKRKADALATSVTILPNQREGSDPLSEIRNSSSRIQGAVPGAGSSTSNNTSQILNSNTTVPKLSYPDNLSASTSTPLLEKPAFKKQNFVQSILDLGQPLAATTCSQCQMSYTPSVPEDVSLHNMWHNRHSQGIELGKPFLKSAMKWCYEVSHIPGSVVVVDRKISVPGRKAVQRVLEVINKELGSVDIKEDELWSQRVLDDEDGRKSDRYKAFLHIIDGKCVGVCLAERITKAHRVIREQATEPESIQLHASASSSSSLKSQSATKSPPPTTDAEGDGEVEKTPKQLPPTPPKSHHPLTPISSSSIITTSEETYPAVVGVSRIWTSKAFRRKGIANNLLDCVMNQFIYGMEMERSDVAFSQPTESGALLARTWFAEDGWAVYREE